MHFVLGFAENSIQLVPDGTLILHVIIILVMVYLLNITLYKPINQILAAREKRTRGRMSEAQEIMQGVGEKLGEYERSLRQARTEAYAMAEAKRLEAMEARQEKLNEMRAQLAASVAEQKRTNEKLPVLVVRMGPGSRPATRWGCSRPSRSAPLSSKRRKRALRSTRNRAAWRPKLAAVF